MPAIAAPICARCVYDASVPGIEFDSSGVCNYCRIHDALDRQYPTGAEGEQRLVRMADRLRREGRGKRYDCVVGVSGGCDSSYLLYRMRELGVRPLAVHFDNTWNSPTATQNIYNVLESLDVELSTLVVNNREFDDILRAFMRSGVKDIEAATDLGLTTTLYRAAEQHGVRYIIEGHSFRTEGIAPLGWIYFDGRYVDAIHRQYGSRAMETFPNLWFRDFMRWATVRKIRRLRPLYWMDYHKEEAKQLLAERLGWVWYGGHHLENRFTSFFHTYWLPSRYGIDGRLLGHAALVRSGQLDRAAALDELARPIEADDEVVGLVRKRLGLSEEELASIVAAPHRHYSEFPTYKPLFERLRPVFWALQRLDRVPRSFYLKYALPDPDAPGARRDAPTPVSHVSPSIRRAE